MKLNSYATLTPALLAFNFHLAADTADLCIDDYKAAFSGSGEAIGKVEICAEKNAYCAYVAGALHRRNQQPDDAERYYLKAIEGMQTQAVLALAQLYTDEGNAVEGFAWSQLYLLVDKSPEEVLDAAQEQVDPVFVMLARNNQALDDETGPLAEQRAKELVASLQPALYEAHAQQRQEYEEMSPKPIRRPIPRYPTEMARQGLPGWAYVHMELAIDGRVGEALVLDASAREFGRSAASATRRWRFEAPDDDESACTAKSQLIVFSMR